MEKDNLEKVLKNTNEKNYDKVNWTEAWSSKYPILKKYQDEVDIPKYAKRIRGMFAELQEEHGYSEEDAMLVLKDILAREYLGKK